MIKLVVCLFIFLCQGIFLKTFAQERIVVGSAQEDKAFSLKMVQGKYYMVGTTRKNAESATDYYVIQLRSNGTVERRYIFGFPRHDVGNQIIVDEKGIFVFGNAYDWGFSNVDMHLFKMGETGIPEWEKFYGTQYQDMGLNAIRTNDGGFALIGNSNSQLDGGDFYLVKTDNNGNVEWEKLFGPRFVDYGFSVVENKSGEFILAGTENGFYNPTQTDFVTHDANILLIKTDANGEQIWYQTYGGNAHDWAKDVLVSPDGGYYVCGSTQSYGAGSFDVFLMKIDENGNQLWQKTFGGSDYEYGEKIALSADGNILISASSASFSANKKPDHFIIKTDLTGNTIWTKVLGTNESDYSSGLVATPDSGLVFTGWSQSGEFGKTDIVFYKLSKDGKTQVISNLFPPDSVNSVLVYPNPAKNKFIVDVVAPTNKKLKFILFDVSGRQVLWQEIFSNSKTEITTQLKNGMYYYRVEISPDEIQIGKIIIQN